MSTSMGESQPKSIQDVKSLLYRKFRVTLVSGRVLEGDFSCLDKQGNIILSSTFEQVTTSLGAKEERHMGLVLIPINQQLKIEMETCLDEDMSMMKLVDSYAPQP